ncbi:hypothetical protein L1987_60964 [Smallanthus sonchifolius]|uniref:Uncharacterized protein n=1 Tax=Smallanthus sonchifolius TaxID=185202 RepID=A0ACB9D9F4_9ASTR|nr:hypothetical protein L1987_60964 [Smallanthus sonchifolius]
MKISLDDRSVKYPLGIVENLLVKVGNFVFPMDFIILDMEVDDRVPLILGRPYLRTAKAMIDVFDGKLTLRVGDESITFDTMKPVKDVGEHSHSVCMLDAFIGDHQDSDLEREVVETGPNLGKISEWALELEKMLDEPDEDDDEVPDDLLEMMAEFDEIIGKSPSLGMIEESIEDPEDPGERLKATPLVISHIESFTFTCVHAEGIEAESSPKSRPPRKKLRELSEFVDLERVKTPSVGMFRGDNLLGYLNRVIFGLGRFKLWWKDWIDAYDIHLSFDRGRNLMRMWRTGRPRRMKSVSVRIKEKPPDRCVYVLGKCLGCRVCVHYMGFALDSVRKIVKNEVPGFIISSVLNIHSGGIDHHLYEVCKGNPTVCATATEMLYGAHKEERSCTFLDLSSDSIADFFEDEKRLSIREELELKRSIRVKKRAHENPAKVRKKSDLCLIIDSVH